HFTNARTGLALIWRLRRNSADISPFRTCSNRVRTRAIGAASVTRRMRSTTKRRGSEILRKSSAHSVSSGSSRLFEKGLGRSGPATPDLAGSLPDDVQFVARAGRTAGFSGSPNRPANAGDLTAPQDFVPPARPQVLTA